MNAIRNFRSSTELKASVKSKRMQVSNFKRSYLGHLLFIVLGIFSLYFWQERTLILDAAFQSYLFISTGYPAIMVERFGAGLTHLLPLLGVYLGLKLKYVLIFYSLSVTT